MQPFRLRHDARPWFKELRDHSFKIDFDSFYFCFIAGITVERKLQIDLDKTAELVTYFPDPYKTRGKLLVSLFLARELKALGITMDDRQSVHKMIAKLVMPNSPHFLSDEGVIEFNKYAHAGFDVLHHEWFMDRPRTLETFLPAFKQKIDSYKFS